MDGKQASALLFPGHAALSALYDFVLNHKPQMVRVRVRVRVRVGVRVRVRARVRVRVRVKVRVSPWSPCVPHSPAGACARTRGAAAS